MLKRMRTYLGVIFAIFARDVKRVLRNPVALVIALGMIVMPSAYAWYVVAANWDPYSNTADMLVAVANEDAGADSPETGHLDVGAQVVAQLHDNHEMGWEFTDAEAAINGVYEGRYWAALVIPKDFSEDFASVFTGDFTQPTIDYYVNEKPSSIAPKVTDAAANAVEAAVNENFVKTVSEKVVETTQKVGAEAEEKADAAEGSLTAGVRSAKETVGETRATLEGLVGTVDDTRTSVARADDTLAGLQDDVPHLLEAIGQSKELLAKARSTVNEYGTALSKNATDGALQLSSAAAQAQRALGTVSGDVAAAEAATNTALATAEGLLADNKTLVSDLTAQAGAADADPAIAQALSEARAANERLTTTTDALRTASDDLASTADSLETEASALDTAAHSASETIRATAATFQGSVLPDITTSLPSSLGNYSRHRAHPFQGRVLAILGQLGDTLTWIPWWNPSDSLGQGPDARTPSLAEAPILRARNDLTAQAGAAGAEPAIAQALSEARDANERLTTTTDALRTASDDLASTADSLETEASTLDTAAQSASETIRTTAATFQDSVLPDITTSLDSLVEACGTLEGALRGLTPSLAEARAILGQLGDTLTSSETSLSTTSDSLGTMETNLEQSLTDLTALQNSATVKDLAEYLKADPEKIGAFMAAPVALDTQLVYPVKNYGSGVAPFFTNLALWVAGFILMAMVKLRVDPEGLPKFTAVQAYFGRWLFYVVCGLAMGLVCCVGDLALGIQCESPAAFIGAGLLTVFVDVNLMFALAYAFRHIGKAIAVILLIVQIPGSAQAERFHRAYPVLRRIGWVALVAQPLVTFAIMVLVHADVDTRVMMLMAMVVGGHRGGHVSHRDFIPGHQPRAPACPGEPEHRGTAEARQRANRW